MRHLFFYLLCTAALGLTLMLGQSYHWQWDWSDAGRNSLHQQTRELLDHLDQPLQITVFMADFPVQRGAVKLLLDKYQALQPLLQWRFVNPAQHPHQVQRLGIQQMPRFLVEYQGRQEIIKTLDESTLSNAIARLSLKQRGWIINIQGHGEPRLLGDDNRDMGRFAADLKTQGYALIDLDLSTTGQLPRNTRLLLLSAPKQALSDSELQLILDYIHTGGHFLWLAEGIIPSALAKALQLRFLPGTLVDAAAADVGMDSPTVAVGRNDANHVTVKNLPGPVLMPSAHAFTHEDGSFTGVPLLHSGARSWNETGALRGNIRRDPLRGEQAGPLTLAMALKNATDTRIAVVGDADFLSNAFIGHAANKGFALALAHWLYGNPQLLSIPVSGAADQQLRWSATQNAWMAGIFLFFIPLGLTLAGLIITYRRRKA